MRNSNEYREDLRFPVHNVIRAIANIFEKSEEEMVNEL